MDPASTAMGAIGLFGLFTTCMSCFEYIQYGRRFGQDYEQAVLKLDICRLRLHRWARSIGLLSNNSKQLLIEESLSDREIEIAKTLLGSIFEAFENVRRLSNQYEQRQKVLNSGSKQTQALEVMGSDDASLSARTAKMHKKVKAQMLTRQMSTSTLDKTRWALYEKKRFDDLVRDIKELTDALIESFPDTLLLQNQLALQDVRKISSDAKDRALLKCAADSADNILHRAVEHAIVEHDGQHFRNVRLSGQSKVFLGNDVAYGVHVKGNTYSNLVIDGNAVVHAGNVYRGREQCQVEFGQETNTRRALTELGNSQSLLQRWR